MSTKRREGRPSKYLPEYCEKLISHGKAGHTTFRSFSKVIGVCERTTYRWLEAHPEFAEAHAQFMKRPWSADLPMGLAQVETKKGEK